MDSYEMDQVIQKVVRAIETIQDGVCKRVDVNNDIKVYECKNVIRIDIKQDNGQ